MYKVVEKEWKNTHRKCQIWACALSAIIPVAAVSWWLSYPLPRPSLVSSVSWSHNTMRYIKQPALQIIRSDLTTIFQSDQRQTKAAINLQYHSSSRVAVQSQNFFFKLLSLKSYHNLYTPLSAAVISERTLTYYLGFVHHIYSGFFNSK